MLTLFTDNSGKSDPYVFPAKAGDTKTAFTVFEFL